MKDRLGLTALLISIPATAYLIHRYRSGGLFFGTTAKFLKQVVIDLDLPAVFLVFVDWMPAAILAVGLLTVIAAIFFGDQAHREGTKNSIRRNR